jgi:hypothetical protein
VCLHSDRTVGRHAIIGILASLLLPALGRPRPAQGIQPEQSQTTATRLAQADDNNDRVVPNWYHENVEAEPNRFNRGREGDEFCRNHKDNTNTLHLTDGLLGITFDPPEVQMSATKASLKWAAASTPACAPWQ